MILDGLTNLTEILPLVLRNLRALEHILKQYKDKTIEEKFNNYRFADYKKTVIDLLIRITTLRVQTINIISPMTYDDNEQKIEM
ncbi:hypothetical protein [Geminocystis sp. NIES-3709]|uniref:hypothetical protein n=1 Tax=Geminocystis sp. NIES-3709 TaxID=1617448 RepID=UPI0005FC4743|nr:hypothetical protein [Geminocystis sp. NIES-3709]BAQ65006.1 DNA or RNA helicase of superfamily II [Geminocystis sp. NIES-3709]